MVAPRSLNPCLLNPLLTAVIVAMGLLATGCSSTKAPTFAAVQAETNERTADGLRLTFNILATNPNPDPLPLHAAEYTLTMNGTTVFRGTRSPEATVPPFGEQAFELPAVIPAELVPEGAAAEYRLVGTVSFMQPGRLNEILFDRDLRVPTVPLRVGGTITFDPAPAAD